MDSPVAAADLHTDDVDDEAAAMTAEEQRYQEEVVVATQLRKEAGEHQLAGVEVQMAVAHWMPEEEARSSCFHPLQ